MLNKKIFLLIMVLSLIFTPAYAVDQWDKDEVLGTRSVSDIDAYMQTNNEALDRLLYYYRRDARVTPDGNATIEVLAGEVACANAGGTIVKYRRNPAVTSVTWANIDTGAEASSTQYYVYAVADTDAATFTIEVSTSASAPTGATQYSKIGYFYNNSSGHIQDVGNFKGGNVGNEVTIVGTSDISMSGTTATLMTDMQMKFVSGGGLVTVHFDAYTQSPSTGYGWPLIYIDSASKGKGHGMAVNDYAGMSAMWSGILSAGVHTIEIYWVSGSAGYTLYQGSATYGPRVLTVRES